MNPFDTEHLRKLGIQHEYDIMRMQHKFAVDADRYSEQQAQSLAQAALGMQAAMNVSAIYGWGGLGQRRAEHGLSAPKPTLKDMRESRWRNKLVRMKDKLHERRMMKISRVAWAVGWLWGSMLIFVATGYLTRWVMFLTFG